MFFIIHSRYDNSHNILCSSRTSIQPPKRNKLSHTSLLRRGGFTPSLVGYYDDVSAAWRDHLSMANLTSYRFLHWRFLPGNYFLSIAILMLLFLRSSEVPVRIIIRLTGPHTGVFGGSDVDRGRCGKIGRWRRGSAGQTIIIVCSFCETAIAMLFFEESTQAFYEKS